MHDPHFVATDFIINMIRISDNRQFIDSGPICFGCDTRKLGKQCNTPLIFFTD
jgi:hypothetical protein